MDPRFLPALAVIRGGSVFALKAILKARPGLASDRSLCGHPTLMQCLILDGAHHAVETQTSMAEALLNLGSPVDEPLVASASNNNETMAAWLLDHGAALNGSPETTNGWTPLEESIYWNSPDVLALLIERGASTPNLRAASGLGRLDEMVGFFSAAGAVRTDRGGVYSPFESLEGPNLGQQLLDNALVYAAMGGSSEAVEFLLYRGAEVNAFPRGFHYRGSALHWAAIRGHQGVCELLVSRGANAASKDLTISKTASDWASHDGHSRLATYLEQQAV